MMSLEQIVEQNGPEIHGRETHIQYDKDDSGRIFQHRFTEIFTDMTTGIAVEKTRDWVRRVSCSGPEEWRFA